MSQKPKRVIVLMMDSLGIGEAPDAEQFGDVGSDTLGHIAEYFARQNKPLNIPNLLKYGLGEAYQVSTGKKLKTAELDFNLKAFYGAANEISKGKDTPSGHWEMAGVPVEFEWGYFPQTKNCFPKELIEQFILKSNITGVLGECHASGTEILKALGEAHIQSKKPIVYTSADSVFQIAAHEKYFGLEKLYTLCEIARELVDPYNIGRVIARPFLGESSGDFYRTGNRRDLSVLPPQKTVLDLAQSQGVEVISIGKIADIYAHQGISTKIKADGNMALFDETINILKNQSQISRPQFIMTNFVDFDSKYGHRRDVQGYGEALEHFDKRLAELEPYLTEEDLVLITADHGCDPTKPGSDHTRENVPVCFYSPKFKALKLDKNNNHLDLFNLGIRKTFADMGQTLYKWLNLDLNLGKDLFGEYCPINY